MTPEETQKAAEVMLEASKGKRIEVATIGSDKWVPCVFPYWNWLECEYRVAPEPFEGWVNVYPDGSAQGGVTHTTKEIALKMRVNSCLRTIKVREVIE